MCQVYFAGELSLFAPGTAQATNASAVAETLAKDFSNNRLFGVVDTSGLAYDGDLDLSGIVHLLLETVTDVPR